MAGGKRMTVTLITLLKRREGMNKEDFIAYYESHHRLIGEKVLGGYATRYVRRHLYPTDGEADVFDADVILEIDFPDQRTMDACFAAMSDAAVMNEIVADEEKLFDRSRMRTFTVEERVSKLT
jgi:EthD domain